jgi:hypothetical protein
MVKQEDDETNDVVVITLASFLGDTRVDNMINVSLDRVIVP